MISTLPSNTAVVLIKLTNYRDMPLETLLQNLCHLGVPVVHKMPKGWWVYLKMHVAAAGTEFKVESECDCPTPSDAARQCAERAIATLKQWAQ